METRRYRIITQVPIHPGALHTAVGVIAAEGGNINRIHYDRRIDPQTVFWDVTCTEKAYSHICTSLNDLGYYQKGFDTVSSLKLTVRLQHRPGELKSLLKITTEFSALITSIAFDDVGSAPDTVNITLDMKDKDKLKLLGDELTQHFRVDEICYDGLEDTSFYVQLAKKLVNFMKDTDESAAVDLVVEIDRMAQDLMRLGEDPKIVFRNVLEVAETISGTCNDGFYADIQQRKLTDQVMLYSIQLPCGGNVYLFKTSYEYVMLDTGYGSYHQDIMRLFASNEFDISKKLSRIIISHGDADHCGAAGFFDVPAFIHTTAFETIRSENRA